jgi:hypothetical protein
MGICCYLLDPPTNSHEAEVLLIEHASSATPNQFGSFRVARNPTGIRERWASLRDVSFF